MACRWGVGGASHAGGPIGEGELGSYRAVPDGQETVFHRTLPLLPHFPQSEDETESLRTLITVLIFVCKSNQSKHISQ